MGLSTKQVSNDHGLDWGQALLPSGALELPEPPPARRQPRQQQSEQLACPRCGSTNTKFCYYNNYNKSQPRHFCKACKRHWTKGGTLRNVPVGGARKNKRLKTSNTATAATTITAAATNKSNTHMGVQSQQQCQDLALENDDQKNLSDIFYQSLINHPPSLIQHDDTINNGMFIGSTLSLPHNQNLHFPFSSLGSIDTNPSSISTSFQSSNVYNFTEGFKSMEDSTVGSIMSSTSSNIISQPWQVLPNTSSVMDMPNYWNWEDIDTFVSADLHIPWDDKEIKP